MYRNNKKKNFDYQPKERYRINDYIRCPFVLLIKDEEKLGIVSTDEAKRLARDVGLDLVEISPTTKPPVCKIMDYSKFKYEIAVKEKEAKKNQKQKSIENKQLRLSPNIGLNDLMIKVNNAKKFLAEGNVVQFTLRFRNREKAHKEAGFQVVKKAIEQLTEVAVVRTYPKLDGDYINCILEPKK